MNETENQENQNATAYDLWPNEPPLRGPVDDPFQAPFVPVAYTPDAATENIRKSGLAWSAGVVFFGAVAFMLFLGWLADWLLGSSPWGIVGGIVLGSVIGFIQFFRISSQIFGAKSGNEPVSFLKNDDDKR